MYYAVLSLKYISLLWSSFRYINLNCPSSITIMYYNYHTQKSSKIYYLAYDNSVFTITIGPNSNNIKMLTCALFFTKTKLLLDWHSMSHVVINEWPCVYFYQNESIVRLTQPLVIMSLIIIYIYMIEIIKTHPVTMHETFIYHSPPNDKCNPFFKHLIFAKLFSFLSYFNHN